MSFGFAGAYFEKKKRERRERRAEEKSIYREAYNKRRHEQIKVKAAHDAKRDVMQGGFWERSAKSMLKRGSRAGRRKASKYYKKMRKKKRKQRRSDPFEFQGWNIDI